MKSPFYRERQQLGKTEEEKKKETFFFMCKFSIRKIKLEIKLACDFEMYNFFPPNYFLNGWASIV